MLAIKIYNKKEKRSNIFNNSIDNIISYIYEKLNLNNARVASDSNCVEIVSGNTNIPDNDDYIVAELLIKKTLTIDKSKFKDREELDKFLTRIKYFCEQAKNIESKEYKPFYLRDKE